VVGYANLGISRTIDRFNPDYLIVYGYNQIAQMMALQHAIWREIPFALRSDSNVYLDESQSWRSRVRRRLLRSLVRRAHAVLPVGEANRAYWQRYGAVDSQIFMAPYAVDNETIDGLARRSKRGRTRWVELVFVGRMLPRKGGDLLMQAFNALTAAADVRLTMVGDGPERETWQAMQSSAARERTRWSGKMTNVSAIEAMAGGDLLIVPSRYEPWGLVVNEAMAAGLPVVAHARCGSAIDLIEPRVTGWTFDELNADALTRVLAEVVADRDLLEQMGDAARTRIANWSIDRTVDGMVSAVRDAAIREVACA
jgi:glycosyltransferase involved in cell wall biosynthesis